MEYEKINTLFKRQGFYFDSETGLPVADPTQKHTLLEGDYAADGFANIKYWDVEEKIDGTNIRVFWDGQSVTFGGRTSKAIIPVALLAHLKGTFTPEKMAETFPIDVDVENIKASVILFGEGYGPKIQDPCGKRYSRKPGFMLFDARVGRWWLKREDLDEIAEKINVPRPPYIGRLDEETVIDFVKAKPFSRCSEESQMMEGVICRSSPIMFFRNGRPVMYKLKCRDYD